ncbi:MAG: HAD family hydrolase [Candidatus Hermodarchaeota archaeon]|nr:HAD family hydrolase [Candidatus Hermodarchaeota archaeon]
MLYETPAKAMLFDLDGTLVKLPSMWMFFDELLIDSLTEFKVPIPPKDKRLAVWHSGGDFEKIIKGWGVDDYPAFIHHFDVLDYEKRKTLIETGVIQLYEDVTVLESLHERFSLGLLTNTPPDVAWLEVKAFQLEQYFDDFVMLGSVEQHIAKPEPEGFLRSLSTLNTSPHQAVMVGDSSSDIIGGNRVGMITVLVERPDQPIPLNLRPPPHLITSDLHDLLQFRSTLD